MPFYARERLHEMTLYPGKPHRELDFTDFQNHEKLHFDDKIHNIIKTSLTKGMLIVI
jgi:hypothetical protein